MSKVKNDFYIILIVIFSNFEFIYLLINGSVIIIKQGRQFANELLGHEAKSLMGSRKIVLAPEALDGAVPTGQVQSSMVEAIAKAYEWAAMLESGEVENVSALALEVKLCRPYVMRILSLVNPAPDIVEAIVYGQEPDGLSLARIFEGFPDDWEQQRKVLGIEIMD